MLVMDALTERYSEKYVQEVWQFKESFLEKALELSFRIHIKAIRTEKKKGKRDILAEKPLGRHVGMKCNAVF